jgi:gliding motility-associated-like protein
LNNNAILTNTITNSNNDARLVKFIVTPYTRNATGEFEKCPGINDTAYVWVEPTPKVTITSFKDILCTNLNISLLLESISHPTFPVKFKYKIIPESPADITINYTSFTSGLSEGDTITDQIINNSSALQKITVEVTPYTVNSSGIEKCLGITNSVDLQITPNLIMEDSAKTYNLGKNIRCYGQNSGAIYLYSTGGITEHPSYGFDDLEYTFQGNPINKGTDSITNLYKGKYTLQVKDFSGCKAEQSITLVQPDSLWGKFTEVNPASCTELIGVYAIVPQGGSYYDNGTYQEGYHVLWTKTGAGGLLPYDQRIIDTIYNVSFGEFLFEVTDSNQCTNDKGRRQVDQTDFKIEDFLPKDNSNYGDYNIMCKGDSNGNLYAWAISESPIFDFYLLKDNDTLSVYKDTASYIEYPNLPAGEYRLHAYNFEGCVDSASYELLEPDDSLKIMQSTINSINGYNISCYGTSDGRISIDDVSGGRNLYNYTWKNGSGQILPSVPTSILNNVPAGYYRGIVNDGYCFDSMYFTLIQPEELIVNVSEAENIKCKGDETGRILLTVTGGVKDYTYTWNPDVIENSLGVNLPQGTYSYTVTDNNSCTKNGSVILSGPDKPFEIQFLESDYHGYNISCYNLNDGWIDASVTGGTQPYSYVWRDSEGASISTGTRIENLKAGYYLLIVNDFNDCESRKYDTLSMPRRLVLNDSVKNKICETGGKITINPADGVPFTNGTYDFIESDDSTRIDKFIKDNLEKGSYSIKVRDQNNCEIVDTFQIEEKIMATSIAIDGPISCSGYSDGKLSAIIENGTAPIIYEWNNRPDLNTGKYENASAGENIVKVIDINGCQDSDTINMVEPNPIESDLVINRARCFDSLTSIIFAATGGTGLYTFLLNNTIIANNYIDSLEAGEYTLTITDANTCHIEENLTIQNPTKIIINVRDEDIVKPICDNSSEGIIKVEASGGIPSYEYYWPELDKTGNEQTNLPHGEYTIKVTDSFGCSVERIINLDNQLKGCLEIPSAFSPNGDGINDNWDITNPLEESEAISEIYPNLIIEIYNRAGQKVWNSTKGYSEEWHGENNFGIQLPTDSYYYIIFLNNESGVKMQGIITIIR